MIENKINKFFSNTILQTKLFPRKKSKPPPLLSPKHPLPKEEPKPKSLHKSTLEAQVASASSLANQSSVDENSFTRTAAHSLPHRRRWSVQEKKKRIRKGDWSTHDAVNIYRADIHTRLGSARLLLLAGGITSVQHPWDLERDAAREAESKMDEIGWIKRKEKKKEEDEPAPCEFTPLFLISRTG